MCVCVGPARKKEEMHPPGWTPEAHYGVCGQSCPCCRFLVEGAGGFGACEVCEAGAAWRGCRVAGCRHARTHATARHKCGKCGGRGHGTRECGRAAALAALAAARARRAAEPVEPAEPDAAPDAADGGASPPTSDDGVVVQ